MQGKDARDAAGVPTFPGESTSTQSKPTQVDAAGADLGARGDVERVDPGPRPETAGTTETAETAGTAGTAETRAAPEGGAADEAPRLLAPEDEAGFRARWQEVQSAFVDDPRDAVHTADALVTDVMQKLADTFADQKQELEGQWDRGEQADTEDLRQALRHYRAFFNRLLVT